MLGGAGSPGGEDLLTVTIVRDEQGYGMKVSGDNPVYVQSVKEHGAAWRAGLRAGDRILRVAAMPVLHHTHQQVVHMIRASPTTVLTVQQNSSRHKTPITAPVPVNLEKQRQLEATKVHTVRRMLQQEQNDIRDLRNELLKVPDVRKQAQLESAELRCSRLQQEIDSIMAAQPSEMAAAAPTTPRLHTRTKTNMEKSPLHNTGFLSGLPRSLSNLTGQSLRNLRQARQNKLQQENQPPLVRQNSDDSNKRRHVHNNTVPMVPTTCLDNVPPPPLPPRAVERPKRNPLSPTLSPPINPLAQPKPGNSASPVHKQYYKGRYDKPYPMHQSMPAYNDAQKQFRRSSHSLDGELEGPQPNSIALQMSYPLVNAPPPPLQTDNRNSVPVLHVRSRSSPEQLDNDICRLSAPPQCAPPAPSPPPGTPPPPYHTNTQPCADPQRAIISMEEDDSPASDSSTYSGLFTNLRCVRESKARTAVLLNWLLGERRSPCACLVLVLTDGYRAAPAVPPAARRRWAYEIHSTFLMPNAVLQLNGVDENMANEIEHVLVNEHDKEEILRNVFRKARQKAKEELAQQLSEFQVKRQVGLATLYGPHDHQLEKCDVDKAQELVVVEQLLCARLRSVAAEGAGGGPGGEAGGAGGGGPAGGHAGGAGGAGDERHAALLAALHAAALCLNARPASVAAAVGASRASFLQRDKLYKQRVKHITKQHPQPFVVRGHHLQLQALTAVAHCHHCDLAIGGLAPQAYVCTDCKLRVHRGCARAVEEGCCLDGEHHNNRISRFMDRIHPPGQDTNEKKPKKPLPTAAFLHMERSFRKAEDEQPWEQAVTPAAAHGEPRREGSNEEPLAADVDGDTSDANTKEPDKDTHWRSAPPSGRGVNRAESCRERDAPRRGKHRNASDPNRLTAHNHHDLEPGAGAAPSGSSSSSSLSTRSNESNTLAAEQHASQSDFSEEDEPLATQWADSLPPQVVESLDLSPRLRKRQEVIHELIVSERSHVRWLKVLGGVFLRPLEAVALLAGDELRALFPNLPDVRERHARLYAELRRARAAAHDHRVAVRPVAAALLHTLGEAGYAACLSQFCCGQRLALDTLRERRRKNKELHQFLASREQLPLCGRLQLRDLLACVWQRLTKYQLLLESILKTCEDAECQQAECQEAEDAELVRRALAVARDVLHQVDSAIRNHENEYRLRTIQSKLEIRVPSAAPEWEELRRLDLSKHTLRMEGDLSIRNDSNKKINVLALLLADCLVLLQREGEKFVLKPIAQSQADPLLPLIKWDKVLFRPNAAVRNTFFLMNINKIQMHEFSANTAQEYATWVRHIQEAARLAEQKHSITPSHHHTRSTDDSGINVSRNPSDASEKSSSVGEEPELPPPQLDRSSADSERDPGDPAGDPAGDTATDTLGDAAGDPAGDTTGDAGEREDKRSVEKEEVAERDDKPKPRRPTVGRVSTQAELPRAALAVTPPALAHTARRVYTPQERLRQLDLVIARALRAKSALVGELLGVPPDCYAHVADMAVAESLGLVETNAGVECEGEPDIHQLLLAAHTQVTQLTTQLQRALAVDEATAVAARSRGRCDHCRETGNHNHESLEPVLPEERNILDPSEGVLERDLSLDLLADLEATPDDSCTEGEYDLALARGSLAARLVAPALGVGRAVGALLGALPPVLARGRAARGRLLQLREDADRHRHHHDTHEYQTIEEMFPKDGLDPTIQDQPSNGG